MADVFISYSRKDKAFVQVLHQALAESNYDAWIDWQDIPPTADWWAEIESGIEAADAFLFVISPDSVASRVCNREVDHAMANHKRLIPIVRREGFEREQLHQALSRHNWLHFREEDEFEPAFATLVDTLNTDLTHVKTHTGLLVRALEWEKKQRSDDLLLRGKELDAAERWLQQSFDTGAEPAPTEHHKNYIHQSRDAANAGRRARRLVSLGGIVLAAGLIIAGSVGWIAQRRLQQANLKLKSAELEQTSLDALQQFEFSEIDALVNAMKAGQELQSIVDQRSSTESYLAHGAVVSTLQQILGEIRATYTFPTGHSYTRNIAYSPDGQFVATTSPTENKAALWDLQGNLIAEFAEDGKSVYGVAFSPDGQTVATTAAGGIVKLWNLAGQAQQTLEGHTVAVSDVIYSPDGERLVTTSIDRTTKIWTAQGELLHTLEGHTASVLSASISPDGQIIATSSNDGTVIVWDMDGNQRIQFRVDDDSVRDVAFSPDGQFIATASNSVTSDAVGRLWDLEGNLVADFNGHSGGLFAVNFSPDGQTVVTASTDKTARLWDLQGNQLAVFRGHIGYVSDAQFGPDGQSLVTVSQHGTVHTWRFDETHPIVLAEHESTVLDVAVSPDGQMIATASDDTKLRLWNQSGTKLDEFEAPFSIRKIDFSPDGQTIAAALGEGTAYLWDRQGMLLQEFDTNQSDITDIVFSPDGQALVTTGGDFTIRRWDLDGKLIDVILGHREAPRQAVFAPNSIDLVTASVDETIRFWDTQGNELQSLIAPEATQYFWTLDFSPDGQVLAAGSIQGKILLWTSEGEFLRSFQAHAGGIQQIQFSPDGQRLASVAEDGRVRLWDMRGRRLGEFVGHQDSVRGIAFAPNGEFLVTGSSDNTARIWQVESLEELLVRGCDWLDGYLVKTPVDLIDLEVCQTDERIIAAVPELIEQGETTAKAGNVEAAIALFQQALEWDTELEIKPVLYAEQFQIIGEGEALAQEGKVQPAIDKFEAAIALDNAIDLNPEDYAKDLAIPALIDQSYWLTRQGNVDAGLDAIEDLQDLGADREISSHHWDGLCWYGSLHTQAAKVMDACEMAVQLTPEMGAFRDSRGLARALTGDIEGAIADFEFYVDVEHPSNEEWRSQRRQWIEALKAGENPFTPEVLENLQ